MAIPAPKIAKQSAEALTELKAFLRSHAVSSARLRIRGGSNDPEPEIVVPNEALELFAQVLEQLAQGDSGHRASEARQLTLQESADLLDIPYADLLDLLSVGELRCETAGIERKIRLEDLLDFKRRDLARRRRILADLTAESQAMGLYD